MTDLNEIIPVNAKTANITRKLTEIVNRRARIISILSGGSTSHEVLLEKLYYYGVRQEQGTTSVLQQRVVGNEDYEQRSTTDIGPWTDSVHNIY